MASIQSAARSDMGCVRKNNEDAWAVGDPSKDIWWAVVCDGMGGYAAGEEASRIAVETFSAELSALKPADLVPAALDAIARNANARILDAAQTNPNWTNMGTTVVAVAVALSARRLLAVHAGDSRLYRNRAGSIEQLTRDHNFGEDLVRAGAVRREDLARITRASALTRALGMEDFESAEVMEEPIELGDLFLLCSDGLTNVLRDAEIFSVIQPENLDASAEELIRRTRGRGAPDNITVVLARIDR